MQAIVWAVLRNIFTCRCALEGGKLADTSTSKPGLDWPLAAGLRGARAETIMGPGQEFKI